MELVRRLFAIASENQEQQVLFHIESIVVGVIEHSSELDMDLMSYLLLHLCPPFKIYYQSTRYSLVVNILRQTHVNIKTYLSNFVPQVLIKQPPQELEEMEQELWIEMSEEMQRTEKSVDKEWVKMMSDIDSSNEKDDEKEKIGKSRSHKCKHEYEMTVSLLLELSKLNNEYKSNFIPHLYEMIQDEDATRRMVIVKMFGQLFSSPRHKLDFNDDWSYDVDDGIRQTVVSNICAIGMKNATLINPTVVHALLARVADTSVHIRTLAIRGCCLWFAKYVSSFWGHNSPLPPQNKIFLSIVPELFFQFHHLDWATKFYHFSFLHIIKIEEMFEHYVVMGKMTNNEENGIEKEEEEEEEEEEKGEKKKEENKNEEEASTNIQGDKEWMGQVNVLLGVLSLLDDSQKQTFVQYFI
ncbi:hypothetical protein RFI_28901, partial [Reticulomyxa filosa]